MTLLQLQDVTYRYKNTAEAVLYQIKYNFEPGKFYSIIGESGAGKSTLLSLLAGLDSPVEGSILSKERIFGTRDILTIVCTIFPWSFRIITW